MQSVCKYQVIIVLLIINVTQHFEYTLFYKENIQFKDNFVVYRSIFLYLFDFRTFYTVKVLIFAASNFCDFSQLDKFAGTFFRIFLIAQKQNKVLFGQPVY
jgi:hypothetical protein